MDPNAQTSLVVVSDQASCALDPLRLFDLLANPAERQKWDLCPAYIVQEPFEGAPGLGREGAQYMMRGSARKIPFVGKMVITAAERPRRFATRSETSFVRAFPTSISEDEFVIEPAGTGSLVSYSAKVTTIIGTGSLFVRLQYAVLGRLFSSRLLKRNFHDTLRYAENYASRVPRDS